MQPIKNPIARLLLYLVVFLYFLYCTIPFAWTFLQSLKTSVQANALTPLVIFEPTLDNYERLLLNSTPQNFAMLGYGLVVILVVLLLIGIFANRLPLPKHIIYGGIFGVIMLILFAIPKFVDTAEFYSYFLNTVIICFGTVVISIIIGSLAGYALARYRGALAVIILLLALAFRALPRMGFILPYYWMGQYSGLYNSYILVIITMVAVNQPFTIWLMRSFFLDIPPEIEEAAMIDGASRLGAFGRVIIPIMGPGIASAALFILLLTYHEFLLVRILTLTNWTVAVAMGQYIGGVNVPGQIPLQSAASIAAAVPIVILILLFQKQIVKGLSAGAVKG